MDEDDDAGSITVTVETGGTNAVEGAGG